MLDNDTLEWMGMLNNPHSYIHHNAFQELKGTLVRQIKHTDFITDNGMVVEMDEKEICKFHIRNSPPEMTSA